MNVIVGKKKNYFNYGEDHSEPRFLQEVERKRRVSRNKNVVRVTVMKRGKISLSTTNCRLYSCLSLNL